MQTDFPAFCTSTICCWCRSDRSSPVVTSPFTLLGVRIQFPSSLLNHLIFSLGPSTTYLPKWSSIPSALAFSPNSTNFILFSSAYTSLLKHLVRKGNLSCVASTLCFVEKHTTELTRLLVAIKITTSTKEPSSVTNTATIFLRCTLRDRRSMRNSTWTIRCSTLKRQYPERILAMHALDPRTPVVKSITAT